MSTDQLSPEVTGIGRVPEVRAVLQHMQHARCCSVVSVSDMGKTALLRALAQPAVLEACYGAAAQRRLVAYVDCNHMLHVSEQGFAELVLRSLGALSPDRVGEAAHARLAEAYDDVLHPSSPLAVPLAISRAIGALLDDGRITLTLLLDEFDEPMRALEGRALLNLRALKDQYSERLAYVTATGKPLGLLRDSLDDDAEEFCELFAGNTVTLGPLSNKDCALLLAQISADGAARDAQRWPPTLASRLIEQTGGHPGLLRAALRCAAQTLEGERGELALSTPAGLAGTLDQDAGVQAECGKLWEGLAAREHRALEELSSFSSSRQSTPVRSLMQKGLLRVDGARLRPFAAVWERYIVRQLQARKPLTTGVRMDPEHNEVWIDGHSAPSLTPLELVLLRALYARAGQVCTKQALVQAIYGRRYIANDLPALQRLVHRLRAKIEPDPARPAYIVTERGHGYRLARSDARPDST